MSYLRESEMSATLRPFIPCTLRRLPLPQAVEAARRAVQYNPANRPLLAGAGGLAGVFLATLSPEHIALVTSKYWGSKGVHLSVKFLDTTDSTLKNHILAHMNAWATRANVLFSESSSSSADVRLARTSGQGYWSYLGTDIHSIPAGQPTMNLEAFTNSTPESEYKRVVRHETGHTLGFPHDHLRQAIVQRLDVAKTIDYFDRTQGWSEEEVRQQVLTPLSESTLTSLPADVNSIMCYQLPGEITVDGQNIPGGLDIDEEDYKLAESIYPKGNSPVGPGTGGNKPLFTLRFSQEVARGRLVQFPAFTAIPAGAYDFTPHGA